MAPFQTLRRRLALAICPELSANTPSVIWSSNQRPNWWYDQPVRDFMIGSHRKMTISTAVEQGEKRFGDRCPSKSAIQRMWARIEAGVNEPKSADQPCGVPAERVANFRKSIGINQRDFAKYLGFSQGSVGQIECGFAKPSRNFLNRMADRYGVSSDWLLHGEGDVLLPSFKSENPPC